MRRQARVTLFVTVPAAIGGMMLAACSSSAPPSLASATSSQSPATATPKPPLKCDASITSRHPANYTTVGVRVRTERHARIIAVAHYRFATITQRRRADDKGRRTLWYQVGGAKRGFQVTVDVTTSMHGRTGYCGTWFSPPKLAHITAPAPSLSAPAPSPPASAASCYPLSNEGTCYEPGEFCRNSDHGATGVAGGGEKIICEDNNGWRWDPA